MTWILTDRATIETAKTRIEQRIADLPIWIRWYRTFDNPGGGGSFGKSKEYCTVELVGVTAKRLKVKDYDGVHAVNPASCFFATKKTD